MCSKNVSQQFKLYITSQNRFPVPFIKLFLEFEPEPVFQFWFTKNIGCNYILAFLIWLRLSVTTYINIYIHKQKNWLVLQPSPVLTSNEYWLFAALRLHRIICRVVDCRVASPTPYASWNPFLIISATRFHLKFIKYILNVSSMYLKMDIICWNNQLARKLIFLIYPSKRFRLYG